MAHAPASSETTETVRFLRGPPLHSTGKSRELQELTRAQRRLSEQLTIAPSCPSATSSFRMSPKSSNLLATQFLVKAELDVAQQSPQPFVDSSSVSESSVWSFVRALAKRDITVPTGQSSTLAISR
ncbi:MAG: hypothetical protein JWQ49_4036 [Edaphobacter sp.]|nr:hypothetical protein [Edaphobacter sp.]